MCLELQSSVLSTITGFENVDALVKQSEVTSKTQDLDKLKQRLPWNQQASQHIQVNEMFTKMYWFI